RARKAILKLADKRVRVVSELNSAHTRVGSGNQNRAERALTDSEADRYAVAAGTKVCRRHAQHLHRRGVETPTGIEPSAVDRVRYRAAPGKFVRHAPRTTGRQIALRRDAGHGFEHAMEVKAAHTGGLRERLEARWIGCLLK